MFNNLIENHDKKSVEPFNLVGRRSLIYSKEEAAKILKDNSYYFFIAAALALGASIFAGSINIEVSQKFLIGISIIYFLLGFCIRKYQSRIASLFALINFGYVFVVNILQNGRSGFCLFTLIFIAASYRSVKASFFYHKAIPTDEEKQNSPI